MTMTVEAIYEQGVLRLKEPVSLEDGAQVEVIVIIRDPAPGKAKAAKILADIAALPLEGDGEEFSGRDHDRILYGSGGAEAAMARARSELSTQYAAPRNEMEKTVAGVWEHLMGVAPIGIYDNFFELGGHSLLAVKMMALIREIFGIDLTIRRIFEAPTIAELTKSIMRDKSATPPVESAASDSSDNLAEMLSLVESLSEAELDALLSEAEAMRKERHG